jgi:hypothetical protein
MCPMLSKLNLQSQSSIFSSPYNISKNWNWHVPQQIKLEIKPHPFVTHLDIWFTLSHLVFHLTHPSSSDTCFSHLSFFFSHSFFSRPFLLSLHPTHFILTTFALLQSRSSGKWSNITDSHNPTMISNKMHSSM